LPPLSPQRFPEPAKQDKVLSRVRCFRSPFPLEEQSGDYLVISPFSNTAFLQLKLPLRCAKGALGLFPKRKVLFLTREPVLLLRGCFSEMNLPRFFPSFLKDDLFLSCISHFFFCFLADSVFFPGSNLAILPRR